jgi:hypothetical protein
MSVLSSRMICLFTSAPSQGLPGRVAFCKFCHLARRRQPPEKRDGIVPSVGTPRKFLFLLIMQGALILSADDASLRRGRGFRFLACDRERIAAPFSVPGRAELPRLFAITLVSAMATDAPAVLYPTFRVGRMASDEAI